MAEQVSSVTRACFYEQHQLRFMRHLRLTRRNQDADPCLHFQQDRLCYSLLKGTTARIQRRRQIVLHATARLI